MSRKLMQKKTVTKSLIRSAFITLLVEKDIEDMTVQEIVEEAMISRSAFYLHYKDKYDLYETIAVNLLDELLTIMEQADLYPFDTMLDEHYDQNRPLNLTMLFLEHIHANADIYAVFIHQKDFQVKFANALSNILYTGNALPRIITNHIAYGSIGTIMEWLTKETPYSIHYVARLLSRLTVSEILEYKNLRIE
ncbi:MAG: TetR/AcrR family transcriptional regulator [Lysinibacillus sp.]